MTLYSFGKQQTLILIFATLVSSASSFMCPRVLCHHSVLVGHDTNVHSSETRLHAKQSGKKKKRATRNTIGNRTQSTSGFGGAAVSPCPCGNQNSYMKCCGPLHSNAKLYGAASAEQVVRARYSAYAKREV